jgi:hypothetical protein
MKAKTGFGFVSGFCLVGNHDRCPATICTCDECEHPDVPTVNIVPEPEPQPELKVEVKAAAPKKTRKEPMSDTSTPIVERTCKDCGKVIPPTGKRGRPATRCVDCRSK